MGNLSLEKDILDTEVENRYWLVQNRAGWAELDAGVIDVTGPERTRWLHKIVTADIEGLRVGQGTRAALLEAKGHVVADFTALIDEESVLLLTEPKATVPLLENLSRYIIREKLKLNDASANWRLFSIMGKDSDAITGEIFSKAAPPEPFSYVQPRVADAKAYVIRNGRAIVPVTDVLVRRSEGERVRRMLAGFPEIPIEAMEVMRIEAGRPVWGIDFDGSTLALEMPDVLAVRVDQGCYVGQEVVARLVHRGHVNRILMGLAFERSDPPLRRDILFREGRDVGTITSAAHSPRFGSIGLGYVRREFSEPGTWLELGDHSRLQVVKIPFEE